MECLRGYTVQPGDTCWAIAQAFPASLPSLTHLYRLNPGLHCETLQPEQSLCLEATFPDAFAGCSARVDVVSGDSCWAMAATYAQADVSRWLRMNPVLDCFPLALGQRVCVAGDFVPVVASSTTTTVVMGVPESTSIATPIPTAPGAPTTTDLPIATPTPTSSPSATILASALPAAPSSTPFTTVPPGNASPSTPASMRASCYISSITQLTSRPAQGTDTYQITIYYASPLRQGWWAELAVPGTGGEEGADSPYISGISAGIIVLRGKVGQAPGPGQEGRAASYLVRGPTRPVVEGLAMTRDDATTSVGGGWQSFNVTIRYPPLDAAGMQGSLTTMRQPYVALLCPGT